MATKAKRAIPDPRDNNTGILRVFVNQEAEVVVLSPDIKLLTCEDEVQGFMVFSSRQARELARVLLKHADRADRQRWHGKKAEGEHGQQ